MFCKGLYTSKRVRNDGDDEIDDEAEAEVPTVLKSLLLLF